MLMELPDTEETPQTGLFLSASPHSSFDSREERSSLQSVPMSSRQANEVPRAKLNAEAEANGAKDDKDGNIVEGGESVDREFYRRFAVDRKILLNNAVADFRFHLEEPKKGTLTGNQLPILPINGMRAISGVQMDRYLACGPSKDPVLHRGYKLDREHMGKIPTNCPLPISVILAAPLAGSMSSAQRDLLEHMQQLCLAHYGDDEDPDEMTNCLQTFLDLLSDKDAGDMRNRMMTAMARNKKPHNADMTKLVSYVGKKIEIERDQLTSIIEMLRHRDQLSRDQADRLLDGLNQAIRDRQTGSIRLIEVQRAVIKVKLRMQGN